MNKLSVYLTVAFLSFPTFSAAAFAAQQVPDGCPTEDAALNAAVAAGRKISCQISYFTGGRGGGRLIVRPINPNPRETIALACIDAQETACPGIAMCLTSPYYSCKAE